MGIFARALRARSTFTQAGISVRGRVGRRMWCGFGAGIIEGRAGSTGVSPYRFMFLDVEDFAEFDGFGAAVRIGRHEVAHVLPPA